MRKPTQIIKIETGVIDGSTVETVNARDLAEKLEIKKDFSNWMKHQIESLDLEENFDYEVFNKKGENPNEGGRPLKEYILTVDAAKHIAMASRTEQGKKVRKYFIAMEKYAKYKMVDEPKQIIESVKEKVLDKKTEYFFAIEKAKISVISLESFFEILSESAESKEFKNILFYSKDKVKKMIQDVLCSFNILQDQASNGDEFLEEFKLSLRK